MKSFEEAPFRFWYIFFYIYIKIFYVAFSVLENFVYFAKSLISFTLHFAPNKYHLKIYLLIDKRGQTYVMKGLQIQILWDVGASSGLNLNRIQAVFFCEYFILLKYSIFHSLFFFRFILKINIKYFFLIIIKLKVNKIFISF